MKIGNLKINGSVFLAPMSDVTNLPFRLMCKKYGASLVFSEMINCDAYLMKNKKTEKRLKILNEEKPVGIQIFGSSIEKLKKAAKKIEKEIKPDLIDINFGCPSYNVMKTGSGASLLNSPEDIGKIVKEISSNISIPLTCKMRILKNDNKTIEIAKIIEKNGASLLTIHGRTAKQGYSGKANWKIIKKIKQELTIPVILNGDVINAVSAKKALVETKCDGLMIGRAAIGNPFIFKEISLFLNKNILSNKRSFEDKIKDFFDYLNLCKKYDYLDIKQIKIQANNYTRGIKGGKELRQKISFSKNTDELKKIFLDII